MHSKYAQSYRSLLITFALILLGPKLVDNSIENNNRYDDTRIKAEYFRMYILKNNAYPITKYYVATMLITSKIRFLFSLKLHNLIYKSCSNYQSWNNSNYPDTLTIKYYTRSYNNIAYKFNIYLYYYRLLLELGGESFLFRFIEILTPPIIYDLTIFPFFPNNRENFVRYPFEDNRLKDIIYEFTDVNLKRKEYETRFASSDEYSMYHVFIQIDKIFNESQFYIFKDDVNRNCYRFRSYSMSRYPNFPINLEYDM
jgi:hypothetical protein